MEYWLFRTIVWQDRQSYVQQGCRPLKNYVTNSLGLSVTQWHF